MADYNQEPGKLNVSVVKGDSLSMSLTFSNDISAYTFSGKVITNIGEFAITVDESQKSSKILGLSLEGSVISKFPDVDNSWKLTQVMGPTSSRTIVAGTFKVK